MFYGGNVNRIFSSFLILVTAALLWLVPITDLIYGFQTDSRTDSFNVTTGVGATTANCVLVKEVYDDDTSTIVITSDLSTDVPVFTSYNGTSRLTEFSGLTASSTRTIDITYDTDALNASSAWEGVLDRASLIWMVMIVAFPAAALAAIFTGRA